MHHDPDRATYSVNTTCLTYEDFPLFRSRIIAMSTGYIAEKYAAIDFNYHRTLSKANILSPNI